MNDTFRIKLQKARELIGSMFESIGQNLVALRKDAKEHLERIGKEHRAEALVADLSNWEVVFALRPVVLTLAATKPEPASETYVRYMEEAAILLAAGYEASDVLGIFEMMLHRARKGGE